jgi:hypothetical protein
MKQAKNNAVDLLLRSLARGRDKSSPQSGSARGDGNETLSQHLDADELNSCAEGVVPAAARARYTEHLADCAACRGIVVGLIQATGAATHNEVSEAKSGLGLFEKLGAIFSPAVLRFAIPALVLTAVIGISLLALRQPRRPELMARKEPADSTISLAPLKQTDLPASQSSDQTSPTQKGSNLPATTESSKEKESLKNEKTAAGEGAGMVADKRAATEPVAKDADQPGAVAGLSELRPSYAPEPKAAAPPPTKPASSEAGTIMSAKEQPLNREEQARQRDDLSRRQPGDEHGPNRSAVPRTGGLTRQGAEGITVRRGGPSTQDKKNKAAEVESRLVSGRRFIREGDAWVDTAYESPRATVKVVRGSEQFRALVADEPGLGTIAQQLDGLIIVVWKNRAYRIQ